MAILFFTENVSDPVSGRKKNLSGILKNLITTENYKPGNISFIFCSDSHLLSINKQYLNHDYFTDIITFDYTEKNIVSGEIYISVDRIKENAGIYKVSFNEELHRIMTHGILHLIGYDDKTPALKKIMTQKENEYLTLFT